jgi:hypothetical protein
VTISAYASKAGQSDSPTVTAEYTPSPLQIWTNTNFPGISDPTIIGPAADPDWDGQVNLLEFALGNDPTNGGDRAHTHPLTNDGSPTRQLLLTIAVRTGTPPFTGTPSPIATRDGITYAILGGLTPNDSNSPVSVVTPAVTTGLPTAPPGYEYRTFKLDAASGLTTKGFLRVRVTTTP